MSNNKRKLPIVDGVSAVDDEPPQSTSKHGKHSQKIYDVIDNDLELESAAQRELAGLKQTESMNPDAKAIVLDQDPKAAPDPKINTSAERVRRSDLVDATPPSCDEYPVYEATLPEITAEMPVSITPECYKMDHEKRGICLVFNHEKFRNKKFDRAGSNVDVKRIKATFSELGFEVIVRNDLKYAEVKEKIEELRKQDHRDNDCVCVFVLTHGCKGDLLTPYDDENVYNATEIWDPFTADNCPTLAGKPKLFFIQACRGRKLDSGYDVTGQSDNHVSDEVDNINNNPTVYTIPALADFMIGQSSVQGYSAWRRPGKGTWYVQSLCDVLDTRSKDTDLLKMLTMTARRVATVYKSATHNPEKHGKKQVSSLTSTLTKDLYFTSKSRPK